MPLRPVAPIVLASCLAAAGLAGAGELPGRELRFDQFYSGFVAGEPEYSAAARHLAGKRVRVVGYAAPAFRAEASFFVMTRTSMHICPAETSDNKWPADVILVYTRGAPPAGGPATIEVTGQLEIGPKVDPETGLESQLRLVDAVVAPAR